MRSPRCGQGLAPRCLLVAEQWTCCPRGDGTTLPEATDEGEKTVTLTTQQLERWLSAPRAGRYLRAAGGDASIACALYEWNARVAAAAFTDTGHLEVALRNAYDRTMCAAVPNWSTDPDLSLLQIVRGHPTSRPNQERLNARSRKAIEDARSGLGGNPEHGRVVGATMFGFWASLTHPDRASTYWTLMIKDAYPGGTSRGSVHDVVTRLNRFRNRLAHNEPVFSQSTGLSQRLNDVQSVLEMLDPDAARWVAAHSTVSSVIDQAPVSGLLKLA